MKTYEELRIARDALRSMQEDAENEVAYRNDPKCGAVSNVFAHCPLSALQYIIAACESGLE